MFGKRIYVSWVLLFCVVCGGAFGGQCKKKSSCSCECPEGNIDFSSLKSKDGPKFLDQAAPDGFKYSYNPCEPFTETDTTVFEDHCHDVAACQIIAQSGTSQFYNLGTQDSVTFKSVPASQVDISDHNGMVTLAEYKAPDGSRQSQLVLVCNDQDSSTAFAAVGELPQAGTPTYRFVIVSPSGCFTQSEISAGSVLLIIFFSCLVLYLILGVLYQKFRVQARGVELIPNLAFWISLPGLVRDGVFLVLRRRGYGNM